MFAPQAVQRNAAIVVVMCQIGRPEVGLLLADQIILTATPPTIQAYFARALCHMAMGHYKLAVNDTNYVSFISPTNLLAYTMRALCLFELGQTDLCLSQLRFFLERNKKLTVKAAPEEQAAAMAKLARVQLLQKDYNVAVREVPNDNRNPTVIIALPDLRLVWSTNHCHCGRNELVSCYR